MKNKERREIIGGLKRRGSGVTRRNGQPKKLKKGREGAR